MRQRKSKEEDKSEATDAASGAHPAPLKGDDPKGKHQHREEGMVAPLRVPYARRLQTAAVLSWLLMLPISTTVTVGSAVFTVASIVALPYLGDRVPFAAVIHLLFTVWAMVLGAYGAHIFFDRRWQRDGAKADWLVHTPKFRKLSRYFRQYFPASCVFDHDDSTRGNDALFVERYFAHDAASYEAGHRRHGSREREDGAREPHRHRSLLFCCHPHGLFSIGVWSTFVASDGHFYDQVARKLSAAGQPVFDVRSHTMSMNFYFPVWREFLMAIGFMDVDRATFLRRLGQRRSEVYADEAPAIRCGVLVPGGAEESVDCCRELLTLKRRQGFIKVALETGATLIPCYTFGETKLYRPLVNPSRTARFFHRLQKILGVGTPLVCGRGVFNYAVGALPHRNQLVTVIGKPIEVPLRKKGEYSQQDVDSLHQRYIEALQDLYARYVGQYGPEGSPKSLDIR